MQRQKKNFKIQGNVQVFLRVAVFSHRFSVGLVLNCRTLAAAALYELKMSL